MPQQQAKAESETEGIVGRSRIANMLSPHLKLPKLIYEVIGIDGAVRRVEVPDPREKLINLFNSEYGAAGMLARMPRS